MGIVIFVMGLVVAVFMSMLLGGLMLPSRQSTTRVMLVRAPADAVWSLVADPAGYHTWRDSVSSVDIEGRAPLRWREYGDDGSMAFEADDVRAPSLFAAHSLDEDTARRTERLVELADVEGGTRVSYTEHVSISNPVARFVMRYVIRTGGATQRLLTELGAALGEEAAIS